MGSDSEKTQLDKAILLVREVGALGVIGLLVWVEAYGENSCMGTLQAHLRIQSEVLQQVIEEKRDGQRDISTLGPFGEPGGEPGGG